MIQESRTLEELQSLETHLRLWHEHPLYQQLLTQFAARIRLLVATPNKERAAPRALKTHEARRVSKQIVRVGSVPELDALVDRIHLRFLAGARRDDVDSLARLRRERLERVSMIGNAKYSPPPASKRGS
jgi:hypothetical protein